MIEWNDQNGIRVFRLSSELFPHKTNSKVEDYTFDFAKDHLKRVGRCARMFDQRSLHFILVNMWTFFHHL